MKMKKIISTLLAVCILASVFCVPSFALSKVYTEGPFSYYIENGYAVINDYDGSVSGELIIPEKLGGYPVGGITRWKFQYNEKITSVVLPEGILFLGELVFASCPNLASVTIPDSLCGVGRGVFLDTPWFNSLESDGELYIGNVLAGIDKNSNAKEITVKDGTTGIADYLFLDNTAIERVILPDSCVYIGELSFCGCKSLKEIVMPEKAVYIGPMAFNNCSSLKRFDIPEGIRYVNNALLFGASSLEAVTIPEGIVYIGDGAFAHTALEAVVIPEGTERINQEAFAGCKKLTEITLPESIKIVDPWAFDACTELSRLNYIGTDEQYSGIVIFEDKNESLLALKAQDKEIQEYTLFIPCSDQNFVVYPRGFSVADYIESRERRKTWGSSYEELLEAVARDSLQKKGLYGVQIGDADKNGKTEASDARTILRASVGLENVDFERIYIGDIDNDKVITSSDARFVLRASVGLEDSSMWV